MRIAMQEPASPQADRNYTFGETSKATPAMNVLPIAPALARSRFRDLLSRERLVPNAKFIDGAK